MTTVAMHFGDGSFHLIEVEATDPDEACEEARTWVKDNAWFQVDDDEAAVQLSPEDIPEDWPVQPTEPGDENAHTATCGVCGLSWNDTTVTSMTPVPSGRCPFEFFHRTPSEVRLDS